MTDSDGLSLENIQRRFAHHPPTTNQVVTAHQVTRERFAELAQWVYVTLPPGPERVAAVEAIDLACMRVNSAIARTQLLPASVWAEENDPCR